MAIFRPPPPNKNDNEIDPIWIPDLAKTFFGDSAPRSVDVVKNLIEHVGVEIYKFERAERKGAIPNREISRRYWVNTLGHAKIVAVSGLMRSWFWAEGVLREGLSLNALAWASCMRALIESAGDASHSLLPISVVLAKNHGKIREALAGQGTPPFAFATDVNNLLQHFTFADKGSSATNPNFIAHPPTLYVKVLAEQGVHRIEDAYARLCGLTHPSAHSVKWMRETRGDFVKIEISRSARATLIYDVMTEFETTFGELFMSSMNPSLCVLKVIREITGDERLAVMDSVDLGALPIWPHLARHLAPS